MAKVRGDPILVCGRKAEVSNGGSHPSSCQDQGSLPTNVEKEGTNDGPQGGEVDSKRC